MFKGSKKHSKIAGDQKLPPWYIKPIEEVEHELSTSINTGLTEEQVVSRQAKYGLNELTSEKSATWVKVLLRQLIDIINWIFVALGIVSYFLGDYITGSLLVVLAAVNIGMQFSQEYAAEQTLAALRSLSSPRADVLRDGQEQNIDSKDLVPGDILLIKEGDSIAADARLIYLSNLETDEALLTGESLPVQKKLVILDQEGMIIKL